MDHLARLVIAALLLLQSACVWSYGEALKSTQWTYTAGIGEAARTGRSPEAAAQAHMSLKDGRTGVVVNGCSYNRFDKYEVLSCSPVPNSPPGRSFNCKTQRSFTYSSHATTGLECTKVIPAGGSEPYASLGVSGESAVACPAGATEVGGKCECGAGLKPNADKSACAPYQCGAPGSYTAQTTPDVEVGGVGPLCSGGCELQPNTVKAGTDGKLWATWPFRSTGKTCGGNPLAPDNPVKSGDDTKGEAPVKCGANQCPGSVNGASVCVPCKNTSSSGPSTAASGVQPSDTPSSDPSKVIKNQETKTECTGTVCTTTTYYKNADGQVIGESKKEESQKSFCDENPRSPMCKEGAFGGSCGGFTCDGDGVQCALALEVHRRNCQWYEVDTALKTTGQDSMNGQAQPQGHPGANASNQPLAFATVIDQTDRLGGAGCPSDVAIAYAGRSWVIPWGQHCDKLQLIGNLAVAVCMLAAAVIVFRS